ncbi:hypothetical protein [Acrididae reovirus]|nr:hypothetical protein [Acrididae reovirus]
MRDIIIDMDIEYEQNEEVNQNHDPYEYLPDMITSDNSVFGQFNTPFEFGMRYVRKDDIFPSVHFLGIDPDFEVQDPDNQDLDRLDRDVVNIERVHLQYLTRNLNTYIMNLINNTMSDWLLTELLMLVNEVLNGRAIIDQVGQISTLTQPRDDHIRDLPQYNISNLGRQFLQAIQVSAFYGRQTVFKKRLVSLFFQRLALNEIFASETVLIDNSNILRVQFNGQVVNDHVAPSDLTSWISKCNIWGFYNNVENYAERVQFTKLMIAVHAFETGMTTAFPFSDEFTPTRVIIPVYPDVLNYENSKFRSTSHRDYMKAVFLNICFMVTQEIDNDSDDEDNDDEQDEVE